MKLARVRINTVLVTSHVYRSQLLGHTHTHTDPVVFVDYRRVNYPELPSTSDAAFQFYFVFLRENFQLNNREVIYSRVVRICRVRMYLYMCM